MKKCFVIIIFSVLIGTLAAVYLSCPPVHLLLTQNPQETAFMRLREKEMSEKERPYARNYQWIPYSQISLYLKRAVIAAEDPGFFSHHGVSWKGIKTAFMTNLSKGRVIKGGSTITQQLAKNLYLSPSRSIIRKVREALIARKMESLLGKRRILELYLNVIEWGPQIYGADAASQAYFHKSCSDLSLNEAIRLAAVLPNPRVYSPLMSENGYLIWKYLKIATRLYQRKWISKDELDQVLEDLNVSSYS